MIVRLRLRAGLYLSALLVCAGAGLAAQATQPVTRSEMESFVYAQLAVSAVAVLGGGAGILAWILARDRSLQREHLARILAEISGIGSRLDKALTALEAHDQSPYAHRAASEHNHAPLEERLDELDHKIDQILRDCETRVCNPRDPMASDRVKRSSDPEGFDGRPERGRR